MNAMGETPNPVSLGILTADEHRCTQMKNTDKDYIFIQFICVNPVHLRLNSLNL